jgi:hypothetical protein
LSLPLGQTDAAAYTLWEPQPGPQALAIGAPFIDELMYGGARGGGKSDFLLGDFFQDVDQGAAWRGIIFRRSYPELEELIVRAKEMFCNPAIGAVWKVGDKVFEFPGGATLKMRHLETEADAQKYQGHQYTWIGWDELTNWPNLRAYKKMKACLRSAHVVRNKRIRCSANPGGVGHHEVKEYFVDGAPPLEIQRNHEELEDGSIHETTKIFIPSRVYDNKILLRNDPTYIARLKEIGSPELVRAWLEGDWNVITGAYFPEFSNSKHVIEPFSIPEHWLKFRSMDWGSASPFAVLWHAVSDGYYVPELNLYIPAGALVTYREYYGWNGKVNQGLRWSASRVGREIAKREVGENITYGVIDPSAFKCDGGPSHAERMAEAAGVFFRKADNNRVGGWDMVRDRLCGVDGDPDIDNGVGTPMWYCFKTCIHIIRTLPAMQHDDTNPEDANTEGEDHAPDSLRYGFMSRPWKRPRPVAKAASPMIGHNGGPTLNDLFEANEIDSSPYVQV